MVLTDSDSDDDQPLRVPYTYEEDLEIINYIVTNKFFTRVKGVYIWKVMAVEMCTKNYSRSWHSLKERFCKHIIPNIKKYGFSSIIIERLRESFTSDEAKNSSRSQTKRRPYSHEDDRVIIEYVLTVPGEVFGNKMWKEFEKKKILSGRTWMSVRNRFLKSILKNQNNHMDQEMFNQIKTRCNVGGESAANKQYRPLIAREGKPATSGKQRKHFLFSDTTSDSSDSTLSPKLKKIDGLFRDSTVVLETCDSPTTKKSLTGTGTQVIVPDKHDSSASEKKATTSPTISTEVEKSLPLHMSGDTIFSATTEGLPTTECCCGDFIDGDDETTTGKHPSETAPCGSQCRSLQVHRPVPFDVLVAAALLESRKGTPAPARTPQKDVDRERTRPVIAQSEDTVRREDPSGSPETLCRIGVARRPSSASSLKEIECTPENEVAKPNVTEVRAQSDEDLQSSSHSDSDMFFGSSDSEMEGETESFIDPLYAQFVDKYDEPSVEVNGYKIRLGGLPFPVVYPPL